MDQDFGVSVLSPIELRVGSRSIIDSDLMGDDKRRLRFTRDDHITKVAIIGLDVALPRPDRESLI